MALSLCRGCRSLEACKLGLVDLEMEGLDGFRARLRCPASFEGGPEVAHGGWTAAMFDDALGRLPGIAGHLVVTAELTISYLKPVPIEHELILTARVVRRDGRRWYVEGILCLATTGAELAKAAGIWVERREDHFVRHQRWLSDQQSDAGTPNQ